MYYSPLRYPGGKNKLSGFIANICIENNINGHYIEPYSGGASVALFLLLEGYIDKITINDMDKSIYAFWYSVLHNNEELCERIQNAILDIYEWKKQKLIQSNKETSSLLDLGFSTFYLNRTNRSGIINAGVMGGINQSGNYLMDCRFNKEDLIKRIKRIGAKRDKINLLNLDAIDLITSIEKTQNKSNIIFYFDPPYYLKASTLYMNHYKEDNHKLVAQKIKSIETIKWVVSYDNVPEIQALYSDCRKKEFSFKHTAYKSREGKEILFFSEGLIIPKIVDWNPINFKLIRKGKDKNIQYIN